MKKGNDGLPLPRAELKRRSLQSQLSKVDAHIKRLQKTRNALNAEMDSLEFGYTIGDVVTDGFERVLLDNYDGEKFRGRQFNNDGKVGEFQRVVWGKKWTKV